jgi:PAS domain S-box-containing protein
MSMQQREQEGLQIIFEEASDGIAIADAEGRYIAVNSKLCEMVGRTREELLSMTIADLVVPEELPHLAESRERIFAGQVGWGSGGSGAGTAAWRPSR